MSHDRWIGFLILLVLFVFGTALFWFIGFQSTGTMSKALLYLFFLIALAGFAVLSYFLLSLEPPIPALQIEVLPASDSPGGYRSEKTDSLVFQPDPDGTVLRTRCALRIVNTGTRPASRLFIVFFFKCKLKSSDQGAGRLVVDYNREKQRYAKAVQSEVEVRDGYPVGYTLRIEEGLTVYPDVHDKHIVAELELIMKSEHFTGEYEIRYRIHSWEGNRCMSERTNERIGATSDQAYHIRFQRGGGKAIK
jgi:hypothetical protein